MQGDIFQKIIEDVVAASQNDFEENGVQPQTLNELQQVRHSISSILIPPLPPQWPSCHVQIKRAHTHTQTHTLLRKENCCHERRGAASVLIPLHAVTA